MRRLQVARITGPTDSTFSVPKRKSDRTLFMMKAHPFRCHLHIQRPESMDVCFHNVVMEVLTAAKNILPNPSLESGKMANRLSRSSFPQDSTDFHDFQAPSTVHPTCLLAPAMSHDMSKRNYCDFFFADPSQFPMNTT